MTLSTIADQRLATTTIPDGPAPRAYVVEWRPAGINHTFRTWTLLSDDTTHAQVAEVIGARYAIRPECVTGINVKGDTP